MRLFARLLDMIARTGLGVLGHQLLVLLPQGVHAVDHLLHQLDLNANRIWHTMVLRLYTERWILTSEYPSLCLLEMS